MDKLKCVLTVMKRIIKIRSNGWTRCDFCSKWIRTVYSIPYLEAGFLVCKKCCEEDVINKNK